MNKHGFTLAELLVVVAIIGILVAISIPVFTAQRRKAVIATNQANIRAAKAAAAAMLYGSDESLEKYENQPAKAYRYYRYNVKKGEIVDTAYGENTQIKDAQGNLKKVNDLGQEYRKTADEAKTPCTDILIYVGNPKSGEVTKNAAPIQTAPFYNGNTVGGTPRNPFGPQPGSYQ